MSGNGTTPGEMMPASSSLLDGVTPLASPVTIFVLLPIATTFFWYSVQYYMSPLRRYPGPFLGAWTNFYRMYHAYKGDLHLVTKRLHEKYGPVVRMAPNYIDVDYPSLIKTCFDFHGVWKKTEWHAVSGAVVNGQLLFNVFSEVRPEEHVRIKKPVAKYFSPAGVAPLEPHVDAVLGSLCRAFSERFAGEGKFGEPFNFGEWMMFYGWDVVAKTTWSHRVGYIEKEFDFDGTLRMMEQATDYFATVGMNPTLDKFLDKNPVIRIGPPAPSSIAQLGTSHLMSRINGEDGHDPVKPDFLDRYLEAQKQYPDVVDVYRILSYMLTNLSAGADTTAIAISSMLYLSLKHPAVFRRLEVEILAADFSRLPSPYNEARQLSYLEAVTREALRYLPGDCFAQERSVPAGGLTLPDGSHVPEGVAIGFNAYVLHRNKETWGADAEEFRPERWLRAEGEEKEAFRARLQGMNAVDLSFGAGSRRCLGINLARMEVVKTVATLVRLFEMELADPDADWTIHNSIFPRQSGVIFRIKKREGADDKIAAMDVDY